jgi:ssDNA-binding Zn-finger/Zn-ribbon topoisomerase 1
VNKLHMIKCSVCGEKMVSSVKADFRIGGTGGTWKLIFGEWAELGEKMIPFYIFVCPKCGKIELFVDEKTKEKLTRSKRNKKKETKI